MKIWQKLIEPRKTVPEEHRLFSDSMLRALIVPLVIEQILVMMVGMADTLMVSFAGETAISGVSLVDMINGVFNYLFSALATGGTIVVSQYIGNKNAVMGRRSAGQVFMASVLLALLLLTGTLLGNRQLLRLLFGSVEPAVMEAATIYLVISAFSYPFLAAYSACSALFRAMGNSRITMYVSLGMNVCNVIGNAIAIFVFRAGVAGVAVSSLISRVLAAGVMFELLLDEKRQISLRVREIFRWDGALLKVILRIAIPNAISNGLFQVCRVVQTSIIALFGTAQIAANGVAGSIDQINSLFVSAMGLAMTTVIGQCVGARDYDLAEYYTRKLMRISILGSTLVSGGVILLLPLILKMYTLSAETLRYVYILVVIHGVFSFVVSPMAGTLSSAIRATGDVTSMMVAQVVSIIARLVFSVVFSIWLDMGIIGIWWAMVVQWSVQAAWNIIRFYSNKWRNYTAIGR